MSFTKKIQKWDDETVLEKLYQLIVERDVTITTQFVTGENGIVTGERMIVACGEKFFATPPIEFDWPLQPMPMPEALKKRSN